MRGLDFLILVMANVGQKIDGILVAADISTHRARPQVLPIAGDQHASLNLLHEVPGVIDIPGHCLAPVLSPEINGGRDGWFPRGRRDNKRLT